MHDVAWAAGFFEGEGYVGWRKGWNKFVKRFYPRVVIQIAQVHKEPLDKFQEIFGVGTVRGPYGPYHTTKQSYYQYTATTSQAISVIEQILPYLFYKGDQARDVLKQYKEFSSEV